MLYLLLSIVCSAGLVVMFKYLGIRRIEIFPVIVVNYWIATLCAFLFLPERNAVYQGAILREPWLLLALGLGVLFILIFNLTGIATLHFGVSTASVAYKLGLVFPVLFAFIWYGESVSALKITGILFALAAVILSSIKKEKGEVVEKNWMFLPLLVFAGSGTCDSLTQYANKKYLMTTGIEDFTFVLFVAAAITGTVLYAFRIWKGKTNMDSRTITAGLVLGVMNYFSFLFLLKALAGLSWGSSVIFPLNNLLIVAVSTIVGVAAFKEKLSIVNMVGLLFAFASISAIIWSNL